jgi:transcriptional regulator with GAF, ATPase, and Fis domain
MSSQAGVARERPDTTAHLCVRASAPVSIPLRDRVVEVLQDAGWIVNNGHPESVVLTILSIASANSLPNERADLCSGGPLLCCGPEISQWPVEVRCRLLRAGIRHFLDSNDARFSSRLGEAVSELVHQNQSQQREAEQLRSAMESLGLVGESSAFLTLLRTVMRVAPLSDIPVLITGETGTGKELFARAIHQRDPRRSRNSMVAINCAALAPGLIESEIFGFRRGAFTGADRDRPGLFRSADGGVLFLDETGELPLEAQAKLLRVLQTGEFLPVGDDRACRVNVRVVAATNQCLETLVAQGKFREDLYYRLNVIRLSIPPLRDRVQDIPPLVHHFFARYRGDASEIPGLSSDLLDGLRQARFPGNVRQLENIVRWALANKTGRTPLELADCPPEIWEELEHSADQTKRSACVEPEPWADALLAKHQGNLSEALEECEKTLIENVLRQRKGNQSETARALGITPRSVYNKLRKYGLTA